MVGLKEQRDLPWRKNKDPYRVWVSEIMLQQTRVEAVKPYYANFMGKFPTLEALANADDEEVLKAWEGLGYYSRAKFTCSRKRSKRSIWRDCAK